ncbi:MAG: hypothetical protein HY040_06170 [Planctomycetes bacterium]|nr:hypothetical protein [Planctomycetota bacterium]
MSQDSALVKRGLVLLALISTLVIVLLIILLQRPTVSAPAAKGRPELLVAAVVAPSANFPASVSWINLVQAAEALPSPAGWEIRYNAARTLALRGSDQVPWDVFLEMLDENRQMCNYRVELQDGKVVPDETAARQNMLIAVRAIAQWHKKHDKQEVSTDLARVYAAVDGLAGSPILEIKAQAEKTRATFFR